MITLQDKFFDFGQAQRLSVSSSPRHFNAQANHIQSCPLGFFHASSGQGQRNRRFKDSLVRLPKEKSASISGSNIPYPLQSLTYRKLDLVDDIRAVCVQGHYAPGETKIPGAFLSAEIK